MYKKFPEISTLISRKTVNLKTQISRPDFPGGNTSPDTRYTFQHNTASIIKILFFTKIWELLRPEHCNQLSNSHYFQSAQAQI